MAVSDAYLDYLRDLFDWLPFLIVKRMFGGAGLYSDDLFFAIAADNTLYFKADKQNQSRYRDAGAAQFSYTVKGRVSRMNFWSLPAEVIESSESLTEWTNRALESALRSKK
ncbi:MAG: TfoX/Sxy family protein [Candidatus Thiodiazotropha sp.]